MASVFDRIVDVPPSELKAVARRPAVLAVALAVLGILAAHFETAASIVAIWLRSETFAHGFVVVPIVLWLVWRQRAALYRVPAEPWLPALAAVLLFGVTWLVATVIGVQAGRQFALAFMVEAAILAVVGLRAARAIAFPMAFLLFAVPFGEFMVPTMIDWTADFTIAALRASGVPVYREANHFVIPSGSWSVVEACSGIRYLIVSVMVGTLYAMVSYRSLRLRAAFIGLSILVPLLANWLRAYGIVMVGHLSNNRLAAGVDHLIYGWLFFGAVMALLFWFGARWTEPATATSPAPQETTGPAMPASPPRGMFRMAVLAVLAAGIWVPVHVWLERSAPDEAVALPPMTAADRWSPVPTAFSTWKPRYAGQVAELQQAFDDRGGARAGLYLAFFRHQTQGRELITSTNVLVGKDDPQRRVAARADQADWSGRKVQARLVTLTGPGERLVVYQLYWVDGRITGSEQVARLLTAWSTLRGRGDDAALVVMYAPVTTDDAAAVASLRRFAAAMSPQIEHTLAAASRRTQ